IFGVSVSLGMTAGAVVSLRGSDTLFDPITRAIMLSGTQITYLGGGSGTGETGLLNHTQGIAPMSRNLTAAIIGTGGSPPSWAPHPENVLGLDAAVILQKNGRGKGPQIEEVKGAATHWPKPTT